MYFQIFISDTKFEVSLNYFYKKLDILIFIIFFMMSIQKDVSLVKVLHFSQQLKKYYFLM